MAALISYEFGRLAKTGPLEFRLCQLHFLDPQPLYLLVERETVLNYRALIRLIAIGYVKLDSQKHLVAADPTHAIVGIPHNVYIIVPFFIFCYCHAQVERGYRNHDEIEHSNKPDDEHQGEGGLLALKRVKFSEFGHTGRRGAIAGLGISLGSLYLVLSFFLICH